MGASAFPPACAFSANPLDGPRRLLEFSSSAHDLRNFEHLDRGGTLGKPFLTLRNPTTLA
jgi:hypothetical protein